MTLGPLPKFSLSALPRRSSNLLFSDSDALLLVGYHSGLADRGPLFMMSFGFSKSADQ